MIVVRSRDEKTYSASQEGAMGRICVGDGRSMGTAILRCATLLKEQEGQAYAHEQSMSHLADTTYGEGAYGSDEG